jgi:ABC-type lipoprotein export system ATPase subunit
LSKIIIDNQKFLILDDIVNSLDFEFRKSIVDLFVNFPDLSDKQFIITTHSEKFLKILTSCISDKDYIEYRLLQSSTNKIKSINQKSDLLSLIKNDLDNNYISR